MGNNEHDEFIKKVAGGQFRPLRPDDEFITGCARCGQCCRNRSDIILSPYDIYHLAHGLDMHPLEVIRNYGSVYVGQTSHIPLVSLRYVKEGDGTVCPFLKPVNAFKPAVCRMYPLGRATSKDKKDGKTTVSYFAQAVNPFTPGAECPGIAEAIVKRHTARVSDWLGGKREMEQSERASSAFSRFLAVYHDIIDEERLDAMDDKDQEAYFHTLFLLLYGTCPHKLEADGFFDIQDNAYRSAIAFVSCVFEEGKSPAAMLEDLFG